MIAFISLQFAGITRFKIEVNMAERNSNGNDNDDDGNYDD